MKKEGPVVSNAGPLMVLAKLNLLHLLKELYGQIQLAGSVYEEVVVEGMRQGYEDAQTLFLFLNQMRWQPIQVDTAEIPADLREAHLDRGEQEDCHDETKSEQAAKKASCQRQIWALAKNGQYE
ncbi:MAG: hypothetical protein P8129_19500 [Anaerolineae bacterium]